MAIATKLRLHKFTSEWDPQLAVRYGPRPASFCMLDFGSINSLWGGIQIEVSLTNFIGYEIFSIYSNWIFQITSRFLKRLFHYFIAAAGF